MFNEEELKHYEKLLNKLGVKDGESQQRVLEFMYTLGTIIYNDGVAQGIIDVSMEKLSELMVDMQPATINAREGQNLDASKRDEIRAKAVREALA